MQQAESCVAVSGSKFMVMKIVCIIRVQLVLYLTHLLGLVEITNENNINYSLVRIMIYFLTRLVNYSLIHFVKSFNIKVLLRFL